MSFSAVYQLLSSTQDEDYVEDLKANLIEMYSCVVFAVNQKKVNYRLYDHFGHLATFVVRTCNKDLHPTVVNFFLILGIPQKLPLLTPRFCCVLLEH
jgi:folate-dependent tRNA-U54 methylase TrmFO/GidA